MPKFSVIVPVYNRPDEVGELLESLTKQTLKDFEVLIIEDGSSNKCEDKVKKYEGQLDVQYFYKENSGPGPSRNFGADKASGEWFIFLDSDTIVPDDYLVIVNEYLKNIDVDAYGGADMDREDFRPIQRAISYSMTSFLTTGGIRGKTQSMEKFKPRSFNMGISRSVFEELGGFRRMRYGEDIDFSLRIEEENFKTCFIPRAFVYHKRRTSFTAFFSQIKHSGKARILLTKLHPGSLKLVHWFPAFFILGLVACLVVWLLGMKLGLFGLRVYLLYFISIFLFATGKTESFAVGLLSVVASFVQLSAYGLGFLQEKLTSPPGK